MERVEWGGGGWVVGTTCTGPPFRRVGENGWEGEKSDEEDKGERGFPLWVGEVGKTKPACFRFHTDARWEGGGWGAGSGAEGEGRGGAEDEMW